MIPGAFIVIHTDNGEKQFRADALKTEGFGGSVDVMRYRYLPERDIKVRPLSIDGLNALVKGGPFDDGPMIQYRFE